ncbi:hypothetical protein SHDE107825_13315 [Shewanella denitrificans]
MWANKYFFINMLLARLDVSIITLDYYNKNSLLNNKKLGIGRVLIPKMNLQEAISQVSPATTGQFQLIDSVIHYGA